MYNIYIYINIMYINIYIYIHAIMKTMCPPSYATMALWQLMYFGPSV